MVDVDSAYPLSPAQVRGFREDGFIKLPEVFSAETLARFDPEVTREAHARAWNRKIPLEQRSTYDRAFLQAANLWRVNDVVRQLSFSRRLARIATELLGTRGVRMYHDQALYKEPGFGLTPWHVDQQYWPLATAKAVTGWVPLQAVPLAMGPMGFGRGSHELEIGRNLPIGDQSEDLIRRAVLEAGIDDVVLPYALGEVSFHASWTLHHAPPNTSGVARRVHTIIYIDADMRLAEPSNPYQRHDWRTWSPSTQVGEIMDDELNPVLYERPQG